MSSLPKLMSLELRRIVAGTMLGSIAENGRRERNLNASPEARRVAVRTAFVARFIVLREGRRSRAHRAIEQLSWVEEASLDDLVTLFRQAFIDNGDKMQPVERDLRRAVAHAQRSVDYFIDQYFNRATTTFREALLDYHRSNQLLFGDDPTEIPRSGGWRIPEATEDAE